MEELIKLINQVMGKKGLSVLQIQKRSGGKIKDSFIFDILKGKTKTLSVEKVHALAEGLGISAIEVFKAASGEAAQFEYTDSWTSKSLLQTMETVVDDPQLTNILKSLVKAKPAKIKAVQKVLEEK
jgi:transcriptional regulator with XRE-family HTH domain